VQERIYRDFFYGNHTYDFFYNYNDIIVVNIRPNGEIEWATRIPKRQATVNDGGYYSSYAMSIIRDKIYFIFNDNARNLMPSKKGRRDLYSYDGKNSVITLAELRKDGSLQNYLLYNNRDAEIITRPKICKQVGKKEMVVYGELGRKFKFASLQFN